MNHKSKYWRENKRNNHTLGPDTLGHVESLHNFPRIPFTKYSLLNT